MSLTSAHSHRLGLSSLLWLVLAGAVLVAALAGSYAAWADRRASIEQARATVGSLTVALQEHALQALGANAAATAEVVATIGGRPLSDAVADPGLRQHMKAVAAASHVRAIWIFDAQGRAVLASNTHPVPVVDIAARPYFQAHAEGEELHIGPAVRVPTGGEVITVSRRLLDRHGRFQGIVSASIDTKTLLRLYDSLGFSGQAIIALYRHDGQALLRHPAAARGAAAELIVPQNGELLRSGPSGVLEMTSNVDGVERVTAFRNLPGLPVGVIAGLPIDDVLAGWWRRQIWLAVIIGSVLGGLLLLVRIGVRLVERQETGRAALAEAERRFRLALQAAPLLVYLVDRSFAYLWISHIRLVPRNAGSDRIDDHDIFVPEDAARLQDLYRACLETGAPQRAELCLHALSGEVRRYDLRMVPQIGDGVTEGVLVAAADVTERWEHQRTLETTLAQRNVLLEEVHHRVKNNLQIIQSLLTMESLHATPESRPGYQRSLDRIQAMGLVHALLYRSGEFGSLDAGDYAQALADALVPAGQNIRVEADPVRLSLDRAVPFGMIVNEAICNALKYACGERADITVAIRRQGERLILRVSDGGPGFPAQVDRKGSLGVKLMTGLAAQLDGVVAFRNRSDGVGAEVMLDIPLEAADSFEMPTPAEAFA